MTATAPSHSRRNLVIGLVPILLVVVTFLFWYQTWFGRELSDQDMTEYLTDTSVPHKTQHALSQLGERMARGDARARQWYPLVVRLASKPEPGFRVMAAWAMGQDNGAEEFHRALLQMLSDPDVMVRRNAALALVRFGDASGRAELRSMLEPVAVAAPVAGALKYRFNEAEPVPSGAAVARVQPSEGTTVDVVSPVAGRLARRALRDGATVSKGSLIAEVEPGDDQVWEALRALALIGTAAELFPVERYARGAPGYSEAVRRQAALTAMAIRGRGSR
jgi:HEAT repeat protein